MKLVHSIGFIHNEDSINIALASSSEGSLSSKNIAILKSVLTAGFYPRIAKVVLTFSTLSEIIHFPEIIPPGLCVTPLR